MSLIETFKQRHSFKTYQEHIEFINQSITEANSLQTPFHSQGVEVSSTEPGIDFLVPLLRKF